MAGALPLELVGAPGDEPLVLAGPPRRLTGQIELRSRSDTTVVVRAAALSAAQGLLGKAPLVQAIRPLVLKPRQQRRLSLALTLDPATPPGEYRTELDVGGHVRSAVLLVSDVIDPRLQPTSIVVLNRGGEVQRRPIVVTNEGNVAFALGDFGAVDLEEDVFGVGSLRLALQPGTVRDLRAVDLPALALIPLAQGAVHPAALRVNASGGAVELLPGETRVLDLELTLQTELPEGRRFRGRIPVLTRDLDVVVVSSTASAAAVPRRTPPLRVTTATRKGRTSKKAAKRPGGKR